jgi:microsomal epoxide hydrolase
MDPRSQGLSSQTSEGNYPEARARDIKAVVDQLKLAPAVLVGWSMGVSDVTAYVDQFGTHTVAGLVFVDGLTDFEPATRVILDMAASLQKDRSAATSDFVRGMYKKAQSEEYLRRITRASLRTPTNTALALLLSLISMERSPALAKINKPVLIVGAAGPFTKNHEETQRRISGSQLKILDGVGHALFVDEADKFNALLEEFLKRL